MNMRRMLATVTAALLLAGLAPATLRADEHGGEHGGGHGGGQVAHGGGGGAHTHYDARYAHNQAYPARGYTTRELPHGAYTVPYHGGHYYYHGGVWYAPHGPRWVVVAPPFGVYVPFLPPFYTTVWFGGMPYYYANDAYYVWRDQERGYEVVEPPGEANASTDPPAPEDVFMYPRNGQSADQQASDRYECHRWAADQTGFDPTRQDGGVASGDAPARRAEYFRAMSACLEGRGYSVK
ncbi:MAG TPA: DUF6515 family protein [Steroidobacteraceae bacterium]|nr:DUF6515 family protein [Steroidobacteraceae bacterium]